MKNIKKLICLMMANAVMLSALNVSAYQSVIDFSSGKTPKELGFTVGNNLSDHKMQHSLAIEKLGEDDVLRWKTSNSKKDNQGILIYELPEVIDFSNGPVEIVTEVKMSDGGAGLWSFPMLCNNTTMSLDDANGDINTYFGLAQHNDGLSSVRIAAGSNRAFFSHNSITPFGAINPDKFCTYKYVIDPAIGGFRFFYKYEGDTEWTEPYKDMVVDKTASKENVTALPKGVFPTRQTTTNEGLLATPEMVDEIVSLKYTIKDIQDDTNNSNDFIFRNISVEQKSLEVLESNNIITDKDLRFVFSSSIDDKTLNAITVTKNGTVLTKDTDYTVTVENGTVGENSTLTVALKETPQINTVIGVDFSKELNKNDGYAKLSQELSYTFECSDIYVSSTNGDDLNDGTKSSPYKTIKKAVEVYKKTKSEDYNPTIYILDDVTLDETIVLDEDCSGITFSAYNDTPVSVSAGYTKGEIQPATSSDLDGKLPREHIGKIIKWDISGYENLADDAVETDFSFYSPELIDNGKVQTIARWPDKDWAYTGEVTADKCTKNSSGYNDGKYIGYEFVTSAPIDNYTLDNAKIRGFWTIWDYRLTRGNILGKGTAPNSLDVKVKPIISSEYLFHENRRYYLYNIPEEITSPGEYYIDYNEKVLYYYPKSDDYNLQLTGLKGGMFELNNCDDVTFYGLALENTRGTTIKGTDADRLTVDSCKIRNAGGRGVWLVNTYGTEITRSYFGDLGDSSIDIHGGDRPTLTMSDSSINNCEFENGARIVGTYSPFIQLGGIDAGEAGAAIGISVENNYFHDHIHSAIIFEGNDFTIKNNIFDTVVTGTDDAGAIYARANSTYHGNKITNNIFRNINSFKREYEFSNVHSVYCDDLLPNVEVRGNVFKNCKSPINFGGGQGHILKNNLFYDCWGVGSYNTRWNSATDAGGGYLYRGLTKLEEQLEAAGKDIDSWFLQYPKFENYYNKIMEYTAAVKNGDTATSDATNENYDILHIFDEEISGNIVLIPDASLGIHNEKQGKSYFLIHQGSSKENQNVNVSNTYASNDLSLASVNGTAVTLDESIINAGYKVPDVSSAGINNIGIYSLNDGKTEGEEILNATDRKFLGYAFEDFDGYTSWLSPTVEVSTAKEFNLSGTGKINSDGMLKITNGNSVSINLKAFIDNDFSLEIKHSGNLKIGVGENEYTSQMAQSTVNVYKYDIEAQKLCVYQKNGKSCSLIAEQNIVLPKWIDTITLTAQSDVLIDWIGLTSFGEDEVKEGIFEIDFEKPECTDARAIAEISNSFEDYGSKGYFSSVIDAEEDGNRAMKISIQAENEGSNYRSEFIFNPIKTIGNEINVEFSIKGNSPTENNAFYLMALVGFDLSAPESEKLITPITEDENGHYLRANDGSAQTLIASADDWASDYVRLKYVIKNGYVYIYKLENSGWNEVTNMKRTVPEYIDRVRNSLNHKVGAGRSDYWLDDIKVYTTPLTTLSKSDTQADVSFGYIPAIGVGAIIAAYDSTGRLISSTVGEYKPDAELSLELSDNNYYIKRFILEDMATIKPAAPAKVLK